MAKKMKKFLALMLALSLCAGQIAVPAMANTTVTGSGTPEDPKVTVTVTVESNGSTTTDTNSVWESVDTQTGGSSTEGNPSIEVSTDITTTVKGSEDTNQNISHDSSTNTETITGSLNGQETTTIEGTTVTTTTTTGALITEADSADKPVTETLAGSDVTTGEWVEGKATDNAWKDDKVQEGTPSAGTTVTNSTETFIPTDSEGATLELTPGGGEVTKINYIVSVEDVANLPTGEAYTIKELKDAKGNLTGWEVTYEANESSVKTNETITDAGSWTEVENSATQTYVKPTLTAEEDADDSDGVTTKIEAIYNTDGSFKGYKVTKTTVTTSDNSTNPDVADSQRENIVEDGTAQANGFTLPEKPAESESTNAHGDKTTVTVTDLMENGIHVGYTVSTVITSAEGATIRTETRKVYGTASTLETDVVKDPITEQTTTITKVTTTETEEIYATESTRIMELVQQRLQTYETTIVTDQDTYQLVETEDGMYFLYKGQMYAVEAIGSHGDTTLEVIQPDMDLITKPGASTDLYNKNGTSNGLFGSLSYNSGNPNGYEFRYVGNGLASELLISRYKDGSLGAITNHQFALQDSNGNVHYVYCADMATSANSGYYYKMENLDDASYFQGGTNAVDHLRAIALNGYWGAEGDKNTIGSLAAVKQLLIDNGYEDIAKTLTEGQALSATQAAIWKFGNHDDGRYVNENKVVTYNNLGNNWISADHADSTNVQVLFELLTSDALMNATEVTETDLIDKEDITGATITVKEAVTDGNGNIVEDSNGNKKYNTDLSFTLKVDTTSITGNLKVYVYANGDTKNPIATKVLAGDGFLSYGIEPDANGTYTISGLEIYEGVNITLNLAGTQELEKGVYLYTSEVISDNPSQTFVGIAEGERDVNLEVDLVFTVEDPKIAHTSTTTTQKRTDTQTGTKTDTRIDTKNATQTITGGEVKTEVSHHVDVYGTVTVTETKKDITKEARDWEAFWQYVLQTISGDDGNEDGGNDTEILDEEVPLAAAPKTGDISALWAALSLVSVGGMVILTRKREED